MTRNVKGRHPHRSEMRALWDAEEALDDLEHELKRKQRELERQIADMQREREDCQGKILTERRKLARACNVAPDTALDSSLIKWMARQNPRDDSTLRRIDFDTDENPLPAETEAE